MYERKTPVLSIILYVLSVLLMAYVVWSIIYSYNYLSELIASGQFVLKGHFYEAFSFYMSNCALYFLFAVTFISIGWIMQSGVYSKHEDFFDDDFDDSGDGEVTGESFNNWINGLVEPEDKKE